jgi:hypothetical protein
MIASSIFVWSAQGSNGTASKKDGIIQYHNENISSDGNKRDIWYDGYRRGAIA